MKRSQLVLSGMFIAASILLLLSVYLLFSAGNSSTETLELPTRVALETSVEEAVVVPEMSSGDDIEETSTGTMTESGTVDVVTDEIETVSESNTTETIGDETTSTSPVIANNLPANTIVIDTPADINVVSINGLDNENNSVAPVNGQSDPTDSTADENTETGNNPADDDNSESGESPDDDEGDDQAGEIPPDDSIDAPIPPQYSTLFAQVQQQGRVPVIVALNVPFSDASLGTAAQVQSYQASLQATQNTLLQELAAFNPQVMATFQLTPGIAIVADEQIFRHLVQSSLVANVVVNGIGSPALLESTGIIGSDLVNAVGFDGSGWTVAILDTGIDTDHPYFTDDIGNSRIVAGACFSSTFNAGDVSLCPGGGAIEVGIPAADPSVSCLVGDPGECNHGSHVAGIAAGNATNVPGVTVDGVAPDADIIAIQIFHLNDDGEARYFDSDLILGLDAVAALDLFTPINVASANLSIGGGLNASACDLSPVKLSIDILAALDIATAVASGNDGSSTMVSHPACISSAVTVGSTDDGSFSTTVDAISSFSNSNSLVDLLAPGRWINSSILNGGFADFQGTSMATPHVTGAWAVMLERNPGDSVAQVLADLQTTGVPILDSRNGITRSRIQLDAALNVSSDLSVFQLNPLLFVIAGTEFEYEFVVINAGPDPALDVEFVKDLPAGIEFVSYSSPDGVTCEVTTVVTCDFGGILAGGSKNVTIRLAVLASVPDGSLLLNTASVSDLSGNDPNPVNNVWSQNLLVITEADLVLDKDDGDGDEANPGHIPFEAVAGGDSFFYTITLTNDGPSDAQNVVVVDTVPAGLTIESLPAECSGSPVVTCTYATVEAGDTLFIDIEVSADPSTQGTVTNIATVSSDTTDPDASNNDASEETEVVFHVDLEIVSMELLNVPDFLIAGEPVVVTLQSTIDNNGPSGPVDTVVDYDVDVSPNAFVSPSPVTVNELQLGVEENRVITQDFTISCEAGLIKTYTFNIEIQPLNEDDFDPDPTNNMDSLVLEIDCAIPVDIDIRPGNPNNPVNPNSNGVVQVAIMSNPDYDFDATTVDPSTIVLEGAGVRLFVNDPTRIQTRDVNGDGLLDAVVRIESNQLDLVSGDTTAVLIGFTFPVEVPGEPTSPGPVMFIGDDIVWIVPDDAPGGPPGN